MVALTGIEPDGCQFSPVQLGLTGCVFSPVGIPGWTETLPRTADVTAQSQRSRSKVVGLTGAGEASDLRAFVLHPTTRLAEGNISGNHRRGLPMAALSNEKRRAWKSTSDRCRQWVGPPPGRSLAPRGGASSASPRTSCAFAPIGCTDWAGALRAFRKRLANWDLLAGE